MNEKIMEYAEREELKTKGWDLIHRAESTVGKTNGFLAVIEAHYWRQREALEFDRYKKRHLKQVVPKKYSPGYELAIDHYLCHWIHSMKNFVPKEVLKYMAKEMNYKSVETPYLPEGMTMYQFKD